MIHMRFCSRRHDGRLIFSRPSAPPFDPLTADDLQCNGRVIVADNSPGGSFVLVSVYDKNDTLLERKRKAIARMDRWAQDQRREAEAAVV